MLEFFEGKNKEGQDSKLPNWVSKNNASYRAYIEVLRLKDEKNHYIERHNKKSHFKTKGTYHISVRNIADNIDVANTTLSQRTTSYSVQFLDFLKSINDELENNKNERLKTTTNRKSRGAIAYNKDELVEEVKLLKNENRKLKEANIEKQIEKIIGKLSLPIRNALGL